MSLLKPTGRALVAVVMTASLGMVLNAERPASGSLTIDVPAPGARLAAGPDYATDVLGDPWDMSNPEDISVQPAELIGWSPDFGFDTPAGGVGTVGGTVASTPANLAFHYRGHYGVINAGRNGRRFPIDSTVYKKFSYKLTSNLAGEHPRVYWFYRPFGHPDGVHFGVRFSTALTVNGSQIVEMDLTQNLAGGFPWAGPVETLVRGLRIDPNNTTSGHQVFFDWVRLTRADSDPAAVNQTITWSGGTGSTAIEVIDAVGTVFTVATGQPAAGNVEWKYGSLPPGAYTLRITSGVTVQTRSFTINTPPVVQVTDPDETGGRDYATWVIGNTWDMNQPLGGGPTFDVQMVDHVINPTFSGGVFSGTSDGLVIGSDGSGDPQATFLANTNNSTPVDTTRYRYLTFKLTVDPPFDLALGSVARVLWGSTNDPSILTTSESLIVFPGLTSYTIDLGALTVAVDGGIEAAGSPQLWTATPVTQLRIDPHEFGGVQRTFHFDDVKLAAMDEAFTSFVITFTGSRRRRGRRADRFALLRHEHQRHGWPHADRHGCPAVHWAAHVEHDGRHPRYLLHLGRCDGRDRYRDVVLERLRQGRGRSRPIAADPG